MSYRLYPSGTGPASSAADATPYVMGLSFKVTAPNVVLQGFWWWVADTHQNTAPQDFALWQASGFGTGTYVTGSKVTSGTLSPGWNYVPYVTPLLLAQGQEYRAVTATSPGSFSGGYSSTASYFSSGPGAAGIVNGPLTAYSAPGNATNPEPDGDGQMVFRASATDVTAAYPAAQFNNSNYWLDVQVSFAASGTGSVALPKPSAAASGYMLPSGTGSVALPKPSVSALILVAEQTSREIVHLGIARFFGGPVYDTNARAYRGAGPLLANGLSTVRAYSAKRIPDTDYVMAQAAGRGMGAYMVVELPRDTEIRVALGGPVSGKKEITYRVILHIYHLAHMPHAEDAEEDVDRLIEAVKGLIQGDRTLGGFVVQAGEGRFGIQTAVGQPEITDERTGTYSTMTFEADVFINA